jgi:AAA domain
MNAPVINGQDALQGIFGEWSPSLQTLDEVKCEIVNAEGPLLKLRALKAGARRLAVPIRHGFVLKQTVVDGLYIQAENLGLIEELGEITILTAIATGLEDFSAPHDMTPPANSRATAAVSVRTAATLRTKIFDPIKYIVLGYIAEGATILAGRPKLGKSWLMLSVGLAVSRAGKCLGDTKCEEGDVLYLALEDNERRLQSRITKLIGFANEWPARFHYATEWPRANAGGLEQIRKWIASVEKPRLIVVDVLAMFRPPRDPKLSPYECDYDAVQQLQRIALDTGVAIVIVHHLRKSVSEVDPFEKVSGTLGLSSAADTVLVLDRDASGATLYGRGRDIEEIETAVEFNKGTNTWRVLGEAAEVRRTNERAQILSVLIDADEPISPRDIAAKTGMPRNNVDQLLFKMAKAGEVLKSGRGHYLHPSIHTPDKNDKKIRNDIGNRAAS